MRQIILGLIMFAFTSLLGCNTNPLETSKPNIIFFIADDMYPHMFNTLPEGKGKNLEKLPGTFKL